MKNEVSKQFVKFAAQPPSDCGCSARSFSDGVGASASMDMDPVEVEITVDGQAIKVSTDDKNIVDAASRAKIGIPAPCYHAKRSKGCCSACVVEIDGEQKFSCSTVPEDGMNIIVDRDDLKQIRKQRLIEYREGIKSGNHCACSSPGSISTLLQKASHSF